MPQSLTLSVIIPTYARPAYFWRCIEALMMGDRLPDEIVVTVRDTDTSSQRAIHDLQRLYGSQARFNCVMVSQPGHETALNAALTAATGDVLVFTDDDAEAHSDWLAGIARHFEQDPTIWGVGGQDIVMRDGEPLRESTRVMGRLSWYGRRVGSMHQELVPPRVVEVDYLKGVNMSYRAAALQGFRFDTRLSAQASSQNEIDLAFFVKRQGGRLIYDPAIKVNHWVAQRQQGARREDTALQVEIFSHHYTYIMLKWLSPARQVAFMVYWFLVGQRSSWGLAAWLAEGLRGRWPARVEIQAAWRGKLNGVRDYQQWVHARAAS